MLTYVDDTHIRLGLRRSMFEEREECPRKNVRADIAEVKLGGERHTLHEASQY